MRRVSPPLERDIVTQPARVLRLTSGPQLVSARAFEEAFTSHLGEFIDVRPGSFTAFLDHVLGFPGCDTTDAQASARFRSSTVRADFVSVDYLGFVALPRLARLRNLSGTRARLLVIAHAPGAYPLDWALLRPLLRPGDRIVAPTESARSIIECLCPDVSAFVRVIPHPIVGPGLLEPPEPRITFLGRVVPGKAVHRLLDAHALLEQRGRNLMLDLAGPPGGPDCGETSSYVRALQARARRLGVEDRVRFLGQVDGRHKAHLLAGSSLLVNLSLSLEESFGKSVAEALAHGVPAVVTSWEDCRRSPARSACRFR
jgi:glycosyltransferase involved in cell wall biosynthesis